jgi:RNase H-fold protein (predicted Holliday junction resolvase)
MEGDIREVARLIKNIIRSKHVKGLIVGYPLDDK